MLIYAAYPVLGYDQKPPWVGLLEQHIKGKGHVLYQPTDDGSTLGSKAFVDMMQRKPYPTRGLHLSEDLARPYDEVKDVFNCDYIHDMIVFRDQYVLLRSDLVIVDGNNPSYGGVPMIAMLAQQVEVPLVLVSNRTVPSPWMRTAADMVSSQDTLPKVFDLVSLSVGRRRAAITATDKC